MALQWLTHLLSGPFHSGGVLSDASGGGCGHSVVVSCGHWGGDLRPRGSTGKQSPSTQIRLSLSEATQCEERASLTLSAPVLVTWPRSPLSLSRRSGSPRWSVPQRAADDRLFCLFSKRPSWHSRSWRWRCRRWRSRYSAVTTSRWRTGASSWRRASAGAHRRSTHTHITTQTHIQTYRDNSYRDQQTHIYAYRRQKYGTLTLLDVECKKGPCDLLTHLPTPTQTHRVHATRPRASSCPLD